MNGALLRVWTISQLGYVELTPAEGITAIDQPVWLERIGLGLVLWEGQFEDNVPRRWLRWCTPSNSSVAASGSQLILTGAERQAIERQRAEAERQRADRLAERLRAMGIDPDSDAD